jgi:transcriptional regulator with XRE-family HTH domain
MRHDFKEDGSFMDDMPFGEYIRKKRRILGMNQTDFAKMLGVKSDSIYSQMSHSKHNGYFCSYQKVEVDDEDESDS